VPTIDADGYRPVDGHAAYDARLMTVVIDGLVLRRAIVPDHYIALRPAPAHHVFQPRHMILQHGSDLQYRNLADFMLSSRYQLGGSRAAFLAIAGEAAGKSRMSSQYTRRPEFYNEQVGHR
jgi:hypothetical protein